MVTGNYSLSLESIDSDPKLSSSKYKNYKFNKNNWYDEVLPKFYDGLPANIAFKVKDDDDKEIMFDNFENQFDDIYYSGCRNIANNKSYFEEFECFAPLYLGDEPPKYFVIFRLDGPGNITTTKDNFHSEIIQKLKFVKLFDLRLTPLGEWLSQNFVNNTYRPAYPTYIDFRQLEFSSWCGIDYEVGGWASKNIFLDPVFEYENTIFDLEKLITDGFRDNKVVFPNILNLSFLFDDTPATPDKLRKWSLNRYLGFYLEELELVTAYSPYKLKQLRNDVVVRPGNILFSATNENPFVDEWDTAKDTYVEVDGFYFKIERYFRGLPTTEKKLQISPDIYSDEVVTDLKFYYKIISGNDFVGKTFSSINTNQVQIGSDTLGYYLYSNTKADLIPTWNSADVWLAKIHDIYHVINKNSDKYYLNSDYGFLLNENTLKYWTNITDDRFTTTVPLDILNPVISISIHRLKFTDIKDFDTSIVDTEFSKYEYEKELSLTATEQPKLYATDYSVSVNPKPFNEYFLENQLTNIPCSSEYTANGETFRIDDGKLSDIWSKNPVRVRWGFDSSISTNDYPYLLNNSFITDDFNMTSNPFSNMPKRWDRNLDYFYTVNSSTSSYLFHSLHVESFTANGQLDPTFRFDLNAYLGINKDYFTWFFGKTASFLNGSNIVSTKKWSNFQKGEKVISNTTLFRGLGFEVNEVLYVDIVDGKIRTMNITNQNTFDDWKFSILVSKNNWRVTASQSNRSIGFTESTNNQLTWYVVNDWKTNYNYQANDLAIYQNLIWESTISVNVTDPSKTPANTPGWIINSTASSILSSSYSVFWTPGKSYSLNSFVFYDDDYYYYSPKGKTWSFWNPKKVYTIGDKVIYAKKIWESTTASNSFQPESSKLKSDFTTSANAYYWTEWKGANPTDWELIELWSSKYRYATSSITKNDFTIVNLPGYPYSIWNGILYQLTSATASNEPPDVSSSWTRKYSFVPDTDFVYSNTNNPIIKMNNTNYICRTNVNGDTLENGIVVYFHKKWKNILINIYCNDNTLPNLSGYDRDALYTELYTNLTSANLIAALRDFSNRYGFSDNLKYVIIDETGRLNTYDINNIFGLPYVLTPKLPDLVYSRYESLNKSGLTLNENQLKPLRALFRRRIETIDKLNYYNGNPYAISIQKNILDKQLIANYHGLKNKVYNLMWRYSGNYSPIFYDIPLFSRRYVVQADTGNFKFDTTLTSFGMMKERIFSKVNTNGNILKLRSNKDLKSVYPMLDEFGYHFSDSFIFKSTWDSQYYYECLELTQADLPGLLTNKIIKFE